MPELVATPKRKRAPRRNFAKELADLKTYCQLSIDIMAESTTPLSEYGKGAVSAYTKILERMNGNGK